jgi:hypothetical protein
VRRACAPASWTSARAGSTCPHGAGGRATAQLIDEIFREAFDNPYLDQGDDQAAFDVPAGRMVMSTDAYVIWPLFFPGGDIGSLASRCPMACHTQTCFRWAARRYCPVQYAGSRASNAIGEAPCGISGKQK